MIIISKFYDKAAVETLLMHTHTRIYVSAQHLIIKLKV